MSDAVVLKARQQYLAKLRPKAKADVGHKMKEPIPYFHSVSKGRTFAKRHPAYPIRGDEMHKNRAVRYVRQVAPMTPPAPIAGRVRPRDGDDGQPPANRRRVEAGY